jgi:glycine betaine catabolism A
MKAVPDPRLETLLSSCRPGWTLPGPFFFDPALYQRDLDRIWRQGWLFAGHSCEIPAPGAYFVLNLDRESVIIIRDEDGKVRAWHNVCRHRGSLLCDAPSGHAHRLVCPYHQWTYRPNGDLVACRGMPEDFDKSNFGLHHVAVEEVAGLIYISLAADPIPFGPARQMIEPLAKPQGFTRARVAKVVDYLVDANWKLVWENNRECYHCNANHPQYIKANFDHYNADDTTAKVSEQMTAAAAKLESKWAPNGIAPRKEPGMTLFPDAGRNIWFSANRTPLVEGYVSETMDGRQVAPLMGDYQEPDVGTLRLRSLPNFWNHSSCDHGVSTRLLPVAPRQTAIRVWWLVAEHAVEGRDYDLAKLLPFWQLTSEQDWTICERQQRGVETSAYQPGPYSAVKEYNVDGFVQWYLKSCTHERSF